MGEEKREEEQKEQDQKEADEQRDQARDRNLLEQETKQNAEWGQFIPNFQKFIVLAEKAKSKDASSPVETNVDATAMRPMQVQLAFALSMITIAAVAATVVAATRVERSVEFFTEPLLGE